MSAGRAIVVACALVLFAPASAVLAESVQSFSASYTVQPDGTVLVVEDIVYDFGDDKRHGIYRTLETDHPQPASAWHKDRYVAIEVTEVLHEGVEPLYELTEGGGELSLRIGNPDVTITGVQRYRIAYTLSGALSYGTEGAELYWNVTGSDWSVPLQVVSATVVAEPNLLVPERDCYVGLRGATTQCDITESESGAVTFAAENLLPGSELTIAQAVAEDRVARVVLERQGNVLYVLLFFAAAAVVAVWGWVYLWRRQTFHKISQPIIAQYEPYPGVLPMYSGVLMDGRLDSRDITAGLIYLAEQGYLHIRQLNRTVLYVFPVKDYEVTLRKDINELANPFLTDIARLLFGGSAYTGTTRIGTQVVLSEVSKDTTRQSANLEIITTLQKDVRRALQEDGYYEMAATTIASYLVPLIALVVGILLMVGQRYALGFIAFGVAFAALLIVVPRRRRTRKGYEALRHLQGFKEFLRVTDQDRFRFHNAPAKSPETFMAYLPYAIAFGVEEEWANAFSDITMPTPEWYEGGTPGTFHATALAHDLGAFSSSFSSASGTSGSSGGGSAGGGGGGGGGGSW